MLIKSYNKFSKNMSEIFNIFEKKNVFDVLKFLIINRLCLSCGAILGLIVSLSYLSYLSNTYISSVRIKLFYKTSPSSPDLSYLMPHYNKLINQEFFLNTILKKSILPTLSEINLNKINIKNELNTQEKPIIISINMNIIINNLIKKYNLNQKEDYTKITDLIQNKKKTDNKSSLEEIKKFSLLKRQNEILTQQNLTLSTQILPIFEKSESKILALNTLQHKKFIQIITFSVFLSFLILLIICFITNFYKAYQFQFKGS